MTAFRFGLVLAIAGLLGAAAPPERAAAPARYAVAQADTLRAEVRAGETLIVALPAVADGVETAYRVVEAPALSWLVDRSFMWRTLPAERGELPVRFERTAGPAGEVVLLVEVVP